MKKIFTLILAVAALLLTPGLSKAQTCADIYGPDWVTLRIDITSDDYPGETSFEIKDACTGEVYVPDGYYYLPDPNTAYYIEFCINVNGHYEFIIHDFFGDGICCAYGNGSYSVTVDGVVVRSGGAFGSSESTIFGSSEPCPPPPANDLCADAAAIACGDVLSGTTIGATADAVGFCGVSVSTGGVWYKWTGDGQVATASTCSNANFDTKISVYSGSCGVLTCVAGNDDDFNCVGFRSTTTFCSQNGVDYYILVHGFSGVGDFDLSLSCAPVNVPNDNICNATALTFGALTAFDNTCAGVEAGEPVPGPGSGPATCNAQNGWCAFDAAIQNTVWFKFVTPTSKAVSLVSGFDGGFRDTQLALWESANGCSGPFTLVAANDDQTGGGFFDFSSAILPVYCLKPNTTYYVQVDGFTGTQGTGWVGLQEEDNKVLVCHRSGNGKTNTLWVAGCALASHLAHGDTRGACGVAKTDETILEESDLLDVSYVQAYPNPFTDKTTIEFGTVMSADKVTLEVFNVTGQKIATLFEGSMGENETKKVDFVPANFSTGMFTYVLRTDSDVRIGKLNMVK